MPLLFELTLGRLYFGVRAQIEPREKPAEEPERPAVGFSVNPPKEPV